ncbi:MAG TPA: hypothetical protein VF638_14175 [Sphingomonas sp.]|jgi:hypothetical protein
MTPKETAVAAMRSYVESAGVPITEFDPEFVVQMMSNMMVSFHKHGRVADAYPLKFDAASDVRARMSKYRQTGNKHFLADAANFAMIEAMHPGRKDGAQWGENSAADSPGRTTASGHRLVQEANDGSRIMGETILHVPEEVARTAPNYDHDNGIPACTVGGPYNDLA